MMTSVMSFIAGRIQYLVLDVINRRRVLCSLSKCRTKYKELERSE